MLVLRGNSLRHLLDEVPIAIALVKGLTACYREGMSHLAQRVPVGCRYIPRAQRCSHMITLGPQHILYSYMDPVGSRITSYVPILVPGTLCLPDRSLALTHHAGHLELGCC